MIRFYQSKSSPYCHRVRIVLAEKGLDYQAILLDLSKGDHKTEQFLRLNPLGKVPVLIDDDLTLAESLVINEYLNEEYPYPALMPEDSQKRALARLWASRIDWMVTRPFVELFFESVHKKEGRDFDPQISEKARQSILRFVELADRELKSQDYLIGDFSLADIAFAPSVFSFEKYAVAIPSQFGAALGWIKRLANRPSVLTTQIVSG